MNGFTGDQDVYSTKTINEVQSKIHTLGKCTFMVFSRSSPVKAHFAHLIKPKRYYHIYNKLISCVHYVYFFIFLELFRLNSVAL